MIAGAVRWERTRNHATRYYQAWITQDLFGTWVVARTWGRKGARLGRMTQTVLNNVEECETFLTTIDKRRRAHGYVRVT